MATLALHSDANLPVFTVDKMLVLEGFVAFGDAEDILVDQVIKSDGDAIYSTIDIRRQFMPGNYKMHIVGPDITLSEDFFHYSSAILCHEDVDPRCIHDLLINSNCGENHEHPHQNFINRYDWMHFTNNEGPDESDDVNGEFKKNFRALLGQHFKCDIRQLIFFVNPGRMDDIIAGRFTIEQESVSVIVMLSNVLSQQVIGFAINMESDADGFSVSACILTDQNSKQNFAFVLGDLYLKYHFFKDEESTFAHNVQKDRFTYNIENFLYKDLDTL